MKSLEDYKPGDPVLVREWDTTTWHEGYVESFNPLGSPGGLVGRYAVPVNGYNLWERSDARDVQPNTARTDTTETES